MTLPIFRSLICVLAIAVMASGQGREFPAGPGESTVPNQILVQLNPGSPITGILARYLPGAKSAPLPNLNLHVLTIPAGIPPGIMTALAADKNIVFVEPNRKRMASIATANDPSLSSQWALQTLQAAKAWGLIPDQFLTAASAGTNRIKVAVLDTGVDCTHPDFKNANATSTDSANGGQLAFSLSSALVPTSLSSPSCAWQDDHGHGTHVAGIIAASANNAVGVAGLAYPVQLVIYKVLDSQGSGSDSAVASAIMSAADAGVQIISMSLGGSGYSHTIQLAINYAWKRNVLVICAAGNGGSNGLTFPAGAMHAIGVAATDSNNQPASFSNYGDYVEVAAPGVGIYSTSTTYTAPLGGGGYMSLSGTSMATPFVSALGGLLAMSTPGVAGDAIAQRIQQTATSSVLNGGWDAHVGYGVVNAYTALSGTTRTATLGAVRGQITDPSSVPLQAQVTLNSQTVATDATSGLFRFPSVPAGNYTISVSAPGYPTQNLAITVAPGADTPFTAMMGVSYGSLTGVVTDAGVAVPYAVVQVFSGQILQTTAIADAAGRYTAPVPAGSYTLSASTLFSTPVVSTGTVTSTGSTTVNLTVKRFGRLTGRVTKNGQPVSAAQIDIKGTTTAGTTSDANGYFTSPGLAAGTFSITAGDGISSVTNSNLVVSADADTLANLDISANVVATGTASFVKLDSTTQGSWKGVYGADGYSVIGDQTSNPTYVVPTPAGQLQWVWASSTTDIRGLQTPSNLANRIAGTWYAWSPFTIDLNFTDQLVHQVAIYCLDWDSSTRQQTVDVIDGNGTVLSTTSLANFHNGGYLIWNLSGHVKIRITPTGGLNAVVSGIFFGGTSAPVPTTTGTASFVKVDSTTQGSWKGVYGADGYSVIGDQTSNPTYVVPTPAGQLQWVWASSTTDIRGLQTPSNLANRIAGTWYSWSPFTIDLNFTDQLVHQVAIYCLDWDSSTRQQTVDVLDAKGTVLSTNSLANFHNGAYLVWNLSGHVIIRITPTGGLNAVVSGIFFGGTSAPVPTTTGTASFVKLDSTTQGSWKGVYGADGYSVIGDQTSNPTYVVPTPAGQLQWVWASSTTDIRGLQTPSNPANRIAGTWYAWSPFTIDLNFTDQLVHQVAIYCLDWDSSTRQQTVDVLDAKGTVLSTNSLANFHNGAYLVWNISGHVTLRITPTGGLNAVVSGIFFK